MSKLFNKPTTIPKENESRYEFLNLKENPFPANPVVEVNSTDPRINGNIYEFEIRKPEHNKIIDNFVKPAKNQPNNLRLGYLKDTSYIGRGNGKSAFLIKLNEQINNEYCLNLSDSLNKCFSTYITPPPGGRCKTFPSLVDYMFKSFYESDIIESTLASIRLSAIEKIYPEKYSLIRNQSSLDLVHNLNNEAWFKEFKINIVEINNYINSLDKLKKLPSSFPLMNGDVLFLNDKVISKEDFKKYYSKINNVSDKLKFFFDDLVSFFQAADFNGAFLLVDNFENIMDFQSSRQRKDFALELRSALFDGYYKNVRLGFYSMILVLHAGVESLLSEAWSTSGLENRAPVSPTIISNHVILFEKLGKEHARMLIKKYLAAYRIKEEGINELEPFTIEAIEYIGQSSEYNASKMLKTAYELVEIAATKKINEIDLEFIKQQKINHSIDNDKRMPSIDEATTEDLMGKVKGSE